MEGWKFEKLELEGCGIVATRETEEERKQVEKEVDALGKVLPFLGLELLEEGAREAATLLQQGEAKRKDKERMMMEIEQEMRGRGEFRV